MPNPKLTNETSPYLLNAWTTVAWSEEIARGAVIGRCVAEHRLAIFRGHDGQAHAIDDRCPHRFAPLSKGEVTPEGALRCRYHGLAFASSGQCVHNPHGDGRIPPAARVGAYPLLERYGVLWIWLGDPQRAKPELLPDFTPLSAEHSHVARHHMVVRANYVLGSDNIMDLSHIQFLHPGSLGSAAVHSAEVAVQQDGDVVTCSRHIRNERVPPFLEKTYGVPPGTPVDRWLDVRWHAPALMLQTITLAPAGAPRESGRTLWAAHLFSPETATTAHYWYASCVSRATLPDAEGAALAQAHVTGLSVPFSTEDLPMLEAQQGMIGDEDFWSLKPVLLRGDAAAVRARRALSRLVAEQA